MTRLIHDLRDKWPAKALKADAGQVRACVWFFCVECMGGDLNAARACDVAECPLFRVRPGQRTGRVGQAPPNGFRPKNPMKTMEPEPPAEPPKAMVIDIMAALKRSLARRPDAPGDSTLGAHPAEAAATDGGLMEGE